VTERPALPSPVWLRLAAAAGLLGAVAYLWFGWCVFPSSYWNELRLAPTFALRHGLTVYAPVDGGPLSTWIYGPVPLLLNLPATFAPTAATAILIAGAVNLLVLVLPLAVLCCAGPVRAEISPAIRALVFALSVLLLPPASLVFQTADHAATAGGLLGCWFLTRAAAPSRRDLIAAAVATVLAASSKQTAIFLVLAHVAYLATLGPRGLIRPYLTAVVVAALIAGLAAAAWFGLAELVFNLVQIPGRLPWGSVPAKLALRAPQLAAYVAAPCLLLGLIRVAGLWPTAATAAGRFFRGATASGLVLLPVGGLAYFKFGGDTNVFHSSFYLVPAGLLWAASRWARTPWLVSGLVLLTVATLAARSPEFSGLPAAPLTRHLHDAARLAAVAPGTAWFPYHPLATFYSDGRLDHVEDGIATRHLAGFGIREKTFRRHLPAHLGTVIYPADHDAPLAMKLLPEFSVQTRLGAWWLYQRPAAPPVPRP
jgi:hypothetical protein